jgi:isopentenyl-diphosphate delta-isomerase
MNQTEERKREHIQIALRENIASRHNYWDDVYLIHNALPEINQNDIELSTTLFKKHLNSPIIISAMTGGYDDAKKINENLAASAEKFQIGMGVGSQRSALENTTLNETYSIVKEYDIPLKIANIGASQLALWNQEEILENAKQMVDMIDADILAVCLNFLQEVIQPEGEAQAKGCLNMIKMLSNEFNRPILVKESGAGISYEVAKHLQTTNIAGIDVGGLSGTSFSAVEYFRAQIKNDQFNMRKGQTFWDWGIPTPISVLETGNAIDWELPIIATGGIRNGLDIARALVLGADAGGIAHTLLKPATIGKAAVVKELSTIANELQTTMFLIGACTIEEMVKVRYEYGPHGPYFNA